MGFNGLPEGPQGKAKNVLEEITRGFGRAPSADEERILEAGGLGGLLEDIRSFFKEGKPPWAQ